MTKPLKWEDLLDGAVCAHLAALAALSGSRNGHRALLNASNLGRSQLGQTSSYHLSRDVGVAQGVDNLVDGHGFVGAQDRENLLAQLVASLTLVSSTLGSSSSLVLID